MDRRRFLLTAAAGSAAAVLGACFPRPGVPDGRPRPSPTTRVTTPPTTVPRGDYGPLGAPDANGVSLPSGFTSRVVATTGQEVADTGYVWHGDPDGGATFPAGDGGWTYVSNAESWGVGGVSALEFAADGSIVAARRILDGTSLNCAGGATPWGTWLSCEEIDRGQVWECDPTGATNAFALPALGRFRHEAAVVDPAAQVVYLTEDESDGALYRFLPDAYPSLEAGTLQVLAPTEIDGPIAWVDVPDPLATTTPTRQQVACHVFDGGEGAYFHDGLWFTTKGDDRVWHIDAAESALTVVYDPTTADPASLGGVDNITVDERIGEVFVAEDGGNMEICVLLDDGGAQPFLRVESTGDSELTGPAFSPDGTRLYFSSQRNPGTTFEVTGPFHGSM